MDTRESSNLPYCLLALLVKDVLLDLLIVALDNLLKQGNLLGDRL